MLFEAFSSNAEKENETHVFITWFLTHSCHIFRLISSFSAWNISDVEVQKLKYEQCLCIFMVRIIL